MNYDRASLIKTATDVKTAIEEHLKAQHLKEVQNYEKALADWKLTKQPVVIESLTKALANAKKGKHWSIEDIRYSHQAPTAPGPLDCCNIQTKGLDGLIEFLGTLAEGEITVSALARAGFTNVAQLLRRPC